MPITTRFVRVPYFRAAITSATISSARSDRTIPCAPLAQNAQPIAQPIWDDTHCVSRTVSRPPSSPFAKTGITTVSTSSPSDIFRSSFFVPSEAASHATSSAGMSICPQTFRPMGQSIHSRRHRRALESMFC